MADTKTTHLELIKQDPDTAYDHEKQDSNLDKIDSEIFARGKKFNGISVDANGEFNVTTIPEAENLKTFASQQSTGDFIIRTTGGDASISGGEAWLTNIIGKNRHEGYYPQSVVMTPSLMPRENEVEVSVSIDDDAFIAAVGSASGDMIFTYSTSWSADPATYGITFTGTPLAGDTITVAYAKEVRGTIYVSDPTSFVSTGWNLYNHTVGYARVTKYSDEMGFKISGTYSLLEFGEAVDTPSEERTTITPVSGFFTIPSDGYLFVTGGNNTNTAIWMTWSDWENGYKWDPNTGTQGEFEAYTESVVDISTFMQSSFPYGLLSAGSVHDEINLNIGYAYKRVTRLAYNSTNLATAIASGRQYEYDENYIYLEDATVTNIEANVDGGYDAYDHGTELFNGTVQAVTAQTMYGASLRNKLERDVLTISQQALTDAQKAQVQQNIGIDAIVSAITTAYRSLFVNEYKVLKTFSSVSPGTYINGTISVAKAGYTPFIIAGYEFVNGTSPQGSGMSVFGVSRMILSGNNLSFMARNNDSSYTATNIVFAVRIVYMKNS